MASNDMVLTVISVVVMLGGLFLAVKGKPSMIRERFGSGVSPKNERKFMLTIGGAIMAIGLDMLVLVLLSANYALSQESTLVILGIGVAVFVVILLIGQKYFRR